ncbi:MAG: TonB-dependent receptor [Pseudomonadota bacterium]
MLTSGTNVDTASNFNVYTVTDDEVYGTNDTYNAKFGWRPYDSLLLRGTYGTSFRAPSLSENFLGAQTGFFNIGDPCVVPETALESVIGGGSGAYNPDLDQRDPIVLENCIREGLDPTTLGLNANGDRITNGVYTVEATRGGSLTLDPETSTSYSYGFSFEQPWFESFDLAVSLTYYNIEIVDSIIRPSGGFIIADCYLRDDGIRSQFCDRITRGTNAAISLDSQNLITMIGTEFINRDEETASGFDINVAFNKDLTVFGEPVELRVDLRGNRLEERSTLLVDEEGNEDFQTFKGYWGFPEWRLVNTVNLDYNDYRFTWSTSYLGAVEQDPDFVDEFGSVATGGIGNTCIGVENGGVDCRDFAEADAYFNHSASLYFRGDTWTFGAGVRNVFDQQPPIVDSSEVTAFNNTPLGVGYNLQGRTFFFNVAKSF